MGGSGAGRDTGVGRPRRGGRAARVLVDGIALGVESVGEGPPLLLLHGFTGSARTWDPCVAALQSAVRVVAVDLVGHGRSDAPADPARYRMERCMGDLARVLDRLGIERTGVLGYSMGGRVALHLAAAYPERVAALVLESASPGLADPAEREARSRSDQELAASIEREGIEWFVDCWERLPLFASQAALSETARRRLRAQRLQNRPHGLANSLRGMGAGAQEPLWDRLATVVMPTLVVVGELDARFRVAGARMAASMPRASLEVVPQAGHAVHLERPADFTARVLAFLERSALAAPPAPPRARHD